MISALVLTYNEEKILPQCLEALYFVDEIIVFDSYSTDNTSHVAKEFGAKFIQRKFDNYANQRNEALKAINPLADWILMVDADEIVTSELKAEIMKLTALPNNPVTLYKTRRKDMFQGKWIKHSSGYPTWFGRLFKNGKVWIEREINEEYHTTGKVGYLQQHLVHYPFNKGLEYWFEKHNRYSSMEATLLFKQSGNVFRFSEFFSADPVLRRRAQKSLSFMLPFRPLVVFMLFYVFRMGFLDGKAGYNFCHLRKTYEWMIDIKIKELKEKW